MNITWYIETTQKNKGITLQQDFSNQNLFLEQRFGILKNAAICVVWKNILPMSNTPKTN